MTDNEIDCHVGKKMRIFRHLADLSQKQLAEAIGVSFQQVQKYEKGKNRISASKLWLAALCLTQDIEAFYEGLS